MARPPWWLRSLAIAAPIAWLIAASLPEVMRDRIFPFDSALIAANGALFESLFWDLRAFASAPLDWLWAYYDQYPALSVRRHPPLFGFVAGIIYSITGVSTMSAKLTVMLFGVVFTVGVFCIARRIFNSYLLAAGATLLVVATPQVAIHFRSVWLDIPSLAFAVWAFYFYVRRLEGDRTLKSVLGMVAAAILSLYTYQPTIVLLAGIVVHLLIREAREFYRDPQVLTGIGVLILLMLPLMAFTLLMAPDNLQITTGEIPEEWQEFSSPTYASWMVTDKLSLAYWLFYAEMMVVSYPVQSFGVVLWLGLWFVRKPSPAETLMAVCLLVTYIGFSWLVVKGHRYTLYMGLPASFLTVFAIRDLARRLGVRVGNPDTLAATLVIALAVIQAWLAAPYVPYRYLSGMGDVVGSILEEQPAATILYSGRNDAAFVFYTRSLDSGRLASVHRASVQLPRPEGLAEYVDEYNVDYIVVETRNPGYDTLEIIDRFRDAILRFTDSADTFQQQSDFSLPYGAFAEEGRMELRVFRRVR